MDLDQLSLGHKAGRLAGRRAGYQSQEPPEYWLLWWQKPSSTTLQTLCILSVFTHRFSLNHFLLSISCVKVFP